MTFSRFDAVLYRGGVDWKSYAELVPGGVLVSAEMVGDTCGE